MFGMLAILVSQVSFSSQLSTFNLSIFSQAIYFLLYKTHKLLFLSHYLRFMMDLRHEIMLKVYKPENK